MIETIVEKPDKKLVRDYKGDLVPKRKARSIMGKYYVEGESCFKMDDEQWYRVTSTDKIRKDHYTGKYVLVSSSALIKGVINSKGEEGYFSENDFSVVLKDVKGTSGGGNKGCMNEAIAKDLGYVECCGDGFFYKDSDLTDADKKAWFTKKNIPNNERSKDYNLESNKGAKDYLEKCYKNFKHKTSTESKRIARLLGDFSFGCEVEVINGYLPKRIRSTYGIKTLKDGSLRHENGEGQEFVTVPMSGVKGIEVLKAFFGELSNRCEVNELCSLHYHFGKVRKDKLYVLSLYRLISKLQEELMNYFPYSRFNTIKADGKVYCRPLDDLGIDYGSLFDTKDQKEFQTAVVREFGKLYKFLNHGKGLAEDAGPGKWDRQEAIIDGKKMFRDTWLRDIYTTKSVHHAVEGNKWDRPERYYLVNFLNLFFSPIETVEFRCHEGTINYTKAIIWLLTCASILKYAENVKECLTSGKITLKSVLTDILGSGLSENIMTYYKQRKEIFRTEGGSYKTSYKTIEKDWFKKDSDFKFKNIFNM